MVTAAVVTGAFAADASAAEPVALFRTSTQWTVPANVHVLHVTVVGGKASDGIAKTYTIKGGLGAQVTGDVDVQPGQVLYINVGIGGGAPNSPNGPNTGGWGGGESDIRTSPSINDSLVLAGGGGHGGTSIGTTSCGGNGGNAGATATHGQGTYLNGSSCLSSTIYADTGGSPGNNTTRSGGSGGVNYKYVEAFPTRNAQAGGHGTGGNGAWADNSQGASGGGGGWYGGGGGAGTSLLPARNGKAQTADPAKGMDTTARVVVTW